MNRRDFMETSAAAAVSALLPTCPDLVESGHSISLLNGSTIKLLEPAEITLAARASDAVSSMQYGVTEVYMVDEPMRDLEFERILKQIARAMNEAHERMAYGALIGGDPDGS